MGRYDNTISSRAIIGTFYELLGTPIGGDSWPMKLGMYIKSDQAEETYNWLGFPPSMREWIGGRQAKGLRDYGFTIRNKVFEATLEVATDDLRRDKTGQLRIRIGELVDRSNNHWAKLVSPLVVDGSAALGYDGQYFFDTDHSEGDSGTLANLVTSSEVGTLNVGTAAAPTANEMANAILGVIQHFFSFKDHEGEPINGDASSFLIMVPVNLWAVATQAVTMPNLNTGTGVLDNPITRTGFTIDIQVNPRLTETDVFYVFRTDGRTRPFVLQEEQGIRVDAIAEGSEEEFKNRRHFYGITAIRNVGYGMWQHAIQATLS